MEEPIPLGYLDGSLALLSSDGDNNTSNAESADERASSFALLASSGNVESMRALGSSLGSRSQVSRLLSFAAGGGHRAAVDFLIDECGADINYVLGKQMRTAIHWAARNGHADLLRYLASRGADVHAVTADGVNALAWAVFSGDLNTCQACVDLGLDPALRNRWNCGLIHWACATGNVDLCRWLATTVGDRIDFSSQNQQMHDGLAKAAWNGHVELCKWLLRSFPKKLSVSRRDRAGLNISDIARYNGHSDLADWLQKHPSAAQTFQETSDWLPKEFTMYFRTQRVVPTTQDWFALQDALRTPPDIFLLLRKQDALKGRKVEPVGERFGLQRFTQKEFLTLDGVRKHAEKDVFAEVLHPSELLAHAQLALRGRHNDAVLAMGVPSSLVSLIAASKNSKGGVLSIHGDGKFLLDDSAANRKRGKFANVAFMTGNPNKFPAIFRRDKSQRLFERVICFGKAAHSKMSEQARDALLQEGDMRRKPSLFNKYQMIGAVKNHNTLLKRLLRGLHNLQEGGTLVYYTLSMNPIINEAVVASAIERMGYATIELIQAKAPQDFEVVPGLSKWLVPDPSALRGVSLFRYLESWNDLPEVHRRAKDCVLKKTMFSDHAPLVDLSKTLRMYPHQAGRGGPCFVAVMRKIPQTHVESSFEPLSQSPHTYPKFAKLYKPLSEVTIAKLTSTYGSAAAVEKHVALVHEHRGDRSESNRGERIVTMTHQLRDLVFESYGTYGKKNFPLLSAGYPVFAYLNPSKSLKEYAGEALCLWRPCSEEHKK